MAEALSIKRRSPEPGDISFDSLRGEAIKLIEQLSGQTWSDYNLHDPGITILEQLIYSITDLIYRTEFAFQDYLVTEDGSLCFEALGLHAPADVFSCRATTKLDYRKLLLNAVTEADNVWLTPMPKQTGQDHVRGLYRLSVKLGQGLDDPARNDAIEQLRSSYLGARNLCEDLGEIRVVENIEYELCASIEVHSGRRPADILADIYFACARCIASSVPITNYDQLVGQTPPLDQLFDGPFTHHGFFMDDDMHDNQSGFPVSTLFAVINAVEAVDHVQQLYLAKGDELFFDRIETTGPDMAFDLLFPGLTGDIKVVLTTNGRELPIARNELAARYDEISFKYHTSRSTPQDPSLLCAPLTGSFRPLNRYFSIQNQFPACYGINKLGVPDSAPDDVKARARQLKAYLLIFEQLLVNFLANLDSVKTLFSTRTDPPASYSIQVLNNQQVADLSAVYPADACEVFSRNIANLDDYFERKSRLLDYMLALYGERFSQNSLRHFNYYHGTNEVAAAIVANKVVYLESIVELGRDRAAGRDYSVSSVEYGRCGLALRVAMLLGFEQPRAYSLAGAILEQELELCPHSEYQRLKVGSHELRLLSKAEIDEPGPDGFEQPPLIKPDRDMPPHELREKIVDIIPVKNSLLSDSLLTGGIYIERYRLVKLNSTRDYALIFLLDENQYWQLGSYAGKASAIEAANNLRQFLLSLNRSSEGLHVVEHILLRPRHDAANSAPGSDQDADFFSFRISVIFPRWTARCQDRQFRMLAEETLRLNAPAHVYPEFYWLEFSQMVEFEGIYQQWSALQCDRDSEPADLERSAQRLVAFLLKRRKARQTES